MQRFWTYSQVGVLSITISPSGQNKVFIMCCLKVSWGIAIWVGSTNINLVSTSNTYSTRFKLVDGIKLTSYFNQIGVGTTLVHVENNHNFVANIMSFSSSNIPK
jgi:hypothetical protein